MNYREFDKAGMIDDVIALYTQEKPRFDVHKRISVVMGRIISNRAEIGVKEQILKAGTSSKTEAKAITKEEIEEEAAIIFGDLYEYADDKGDIELKNFASQTDSKIYGLNEISFRTLMEQLDGRLDSLGAMLDGTEITPEVRANFKTALQSFILKAGSAGIARTDVASARERITELFQLIDHDLELLDGLMRRFRKNDPDLLSRYTSARVIIDRGGGRAGTGTQPPQNPEQQAK